MIVRPQLGVTGSFFLLLPGVCRNRDLRVRCELIEVCFKLPALVNVRRIADGVLFGRVTFFKVNLVRYLLPTFLITLLLLEQDVQRIHSRNIVDEANLINNTNFGG